MVIEFFVGRSPAACFPAAPGSVQVSKVPHTQGRRCYKRGGDRRRSPYKFRDHGSLLHVRQTLFVCYNPNMVNDDLCSTVDKMIDISHVMNAVETVLGKARLVQILYWVMATLLWVMVVFGWFGYKLNLDFQVQYPIPSDFSLILEFYGMTLMSLGLALTMAWCFWISTHGSKNIQELLNKSDLAVQLANGTLGPDKFFEFTPWQMRLGLIKKAKGTSFEEVVEHVASLLNWYLDPPKSVFPGLKFLPLLVIFPVILLVYGIGPFSGILLVVYFFANLIFMSWQRVYNLEFANYLRERIEA